MVEDLPAFSVCIPAYNAETMIRSTIESVLAQTFSDFELIIVDDGSTDSTVDVIESFASQDDRISVLRQENAGAPAARNAAIRQARSPRLSFIDNDDVWMPGYLADVAAAFDRHPGVGMVHTDALSFLGTTRRIHRLSTLQSFGRLAVEGSAEEVLPALISANFISASSVTALRTAVLEVGGFEDATFGSEDWDLWLRILDVGYSLARAGERPLTLLRNHPDSASKNSDRVARARVLVAERALERAPGGPQREAAEALMRSTRKDLQRIQAPAPAQRLLGSARHALAPIKHRLLDRFTWLEPSEETRAAFPDFERI